MTSVLDDVRRSARAMHAYIIYYMYDARGCMVMLDADKLQSTWYLFFLKYIIAIAIAEQGLCTDHRGEHHGHQHFYDGSSHLKRGRGGTGDRAPDRYNKIISKY